MSGAYLAARALTRGAQRRALTRGGPVPNLAAPMRSPALLAISLVLLSGCGGPSQDVTRASTLDRIVSTKVLRVGMNPGYAPFEMVDTDGNLIGFWEERA